MLHYIDVSIMNAADNHKPIVKKQFIQPSLNNYYTSNSSLSTLSTQTLNLNVSLSFLVSANDDYDHMNGEYCKSITAPSIGSEPLKRKCYNNGNTVVSNYKNKNGINNCVKRSGSLDREALNRYKYFKSLCAKKRNISSTSSVNSLTSNETINKLNTSTEHLRKYFEDLSNHNTKSSINNHKTNDKNNNQNIAQIKTNNAHLSRSSMYEKQSNINYDRSSISSSPITNNFTNNNNNNYVNDNLKLYKENRINSNKSISDDRIKNKKHELDYENTPLKYSKSSNNNNNNNNNMGNLIKRSNRLDFNRNHDKNKKETVNSKDEHVFLPISNASSTSSTSSLMTPVPSSFISPASTCTTKTPINTHNFNSLPIKLAQTSQNRIRNIEIHFDRHTDRKSYVCNKENLQFDSGSNNNIDRKPIEFNSSYNLNQSNSNSITKQFSTSSTTVNDNFTSAKQEKFKLPKLIFKTEFSNYKDSQNEVNCQLNNTLLVKAEEKSVLINSMPAQQSLKLDANCNNNLNNGLSKSERIENYAEKLKNINFNHLKRPIQSNISASSDTESNSSDNIDLDDYRNKKDLQPLKSSQDDYEKSNSFQGLTRQNRIIFFETSSANNRNSRKPNKEIPLNYKANLPVLPDKDDSTDSKANDSKSSLNKDLHKKFKHNLIDDSTANKFFPDDDINTNNTSRDKSNTSLNSKSSQIASNAIVVPSLTEHNLKILNNINNDSNDSRSDADSNEYEDEDNITKIEHLNRRSILDTLSVITEEDSDYVQLKSPINPTSNSSLNILNINAAASENVKKLNEYQNSLTFENNYAINTITDYINALTNKVYNNNEIVECKKNSDSIKKPYLNENFCNNSVSNFEKKFNTLERSARIDDMRKNFSPSINNITQKKDNYVLPKQEHEMSPIIVTTNRSISNKTSSSNLTLPLSPSATHTSKNVSPLIKSKMYLFEIQPINNINEENSDYNRNLVHSKIEKPIKFNAKRLSTVKLSNFSSEDNINALSESKLNEDLVKGKSNSLKNSNTSLKNSYDVYSRHYSVNQYKKEIHDKENEKIEKKAHVTILVNSKKQIK